MYLSTRTGAWVVGRVGDGGLPGDLGFSRVAMLKAKLFSSRMARNLEEKLNAAFDHTLYGLKPKHG